LVLLWLWQWQCGGWQYGVEVWLDFLNFFWIFWAVAVFVDDGGSVLLVTAEWVAPLDCPCSGGHFGTTLVVAVAVWRVAARALYPPFPFHFLTFFYMYFQKKIQT
jgi:hypothetical protein